jgi:hypothetical protein
LDGVHILKPLPLFLIDLLYPFLLNIRIGRTVSSFQDKAEAGASLFENLFQASTGCRNQVILEVVSKFPAIFSEESNQAIEGEFSKLEAHDALFSMQNGKSLSPDGFPVEFYKHFYEQNLILIIRESQRNEIIGEEQFGFLQNV